MKKITLFILFLSTIWGYSQVKRYTFAKSTTTYQEITGGTVLGNESSDSQVYVNPTAPLGGSALTGTGFPIGFNFTFNGYVYDSFGVATDGWISLGSSAFAPNSVNSTLSALFSPLSSTSTATTDILSAKIAALAKDLMAQAGASISYKTIGDAPNRVLVVQWKKYKKGSGFGTGDDFNFQIRLNETTNKVAIVYGSMVSNAQETAQNFQVGLRAEPAAVAANFATRKSTSGWNNTTDGTAASDTVLMSDLLFPSNGLTYTWTPSICSGAKSLAVSSILGNGATLSWGAYLPLPESYEYIVSTSSNMPLSTDSGTATTDQTAIITNLNSSTVYNVFLRTKCGSEFTPWILGGTFKTLCFDVVYFSEDFDSYTANGSILPDCWAKTGSTGTCFIQSGSAAPSSAPNRLYLFANANPSGKTVAYAVMPAVSNLQAGTNRLKFKAFTTTAGTNTIDVGYFDDTNAFKSVGSVTLPGSAATAADLVVAPAAGVIPSGVKNLVFRNTGNATSFISAYIDNVVWEPIPNCPEITGMTAKKITTTSVDFSWTKAASETQWQYVYGPAGVKNPNTLAPVDVSSTAITVSGLDPGTKYKIWARSKCSDTALGAWMGPVVFSTACSYASQFMDNFDGTVAGNFDSSIANLPSCWSKVGSVGSAYAIYPTTIAGNSTIPAPAAPSAPNVLQLTNFAVVALPAVSNAGAGTNMLSFKMRPEVAGAKMDIGWLTDISDPSTFQFLETITSDNTTSYTSYTKAFGAVPQSPYLAFKNQGSPAGAIFLDDIAWEPISTCPKIADITMTAIRGISADLTWTVGGSENAWQYAVGTSTATSALTLTPVDVTSSPIAPLVTIGNLAPLTSYKVWMRSKCTNNAFGAWIGPVNFTTTCGSVTGFTQNFDASLALPSCWVKVGNGNIDSYSMTGVPTSPYVLGLNTKSPTAPTVLAMTPVSNAAEGTHRLKFKFMAATVGAILEVGYLTDITDPGSFMSLKSFTATQAVSFESQIAELGTDPGSEILAFRNADVSNGIIYIDDVVWEPIPLCPDVKNVVLTSVTGTTADIDWEPAGSETNWQYAIGSISLSDPGTLTPVNVASTSAVTIDGLSPVSSHKVWVRAKCSGSSFGQWVGPMTITTACPAVDSFTQNFDASLNMPSCWNKIGNTGAGFPATLAGAPSGTNALSMYSGAGNKSSVVSMPQINIATAADHILKFKYKSSLAGCVLEVGYLTIPWDATSFVPFKSITTDSTIDFKLMVLSLGNSPVSNMLAFRNTGAVEGNIYIDNVSWEPAPTVGPACATGVTAVPNANCGNFATVISWPAVAGADGYRLTIGTTSGGFDVLNDQDIDLKSYALLGNANTTYYYKVVPYNSFGSAADCGEQTYKTNFNKCYCASVPTGHSGNGITNIKLGASNFADGNKGYHDFSSNPVTLSKGANADLQITFDTKGFAYNVAVYIDLNDNDNFESSEVVYAGLSGTAVPNTVNASFMMPASAALGTHRMRICSVGQGIAIDPCYNGDNGITADITVNVVAFLDIDSFDSVNFSYYPNPVTDVLNLSFNQEINDVSVINLLGQQVISKSINANQGKIDMSGLSKGAYLVKVFVGNQSKTIKVVKE